MASPDVVLAASEVSSTPRDYTVPAAAEIVPLSVTASIDGAAAAGSFVPTLEVLAPSGVTVVRCPIASTLVAGASADVSWFPGVVAAAAAGSVALDGRFGIYQSPVINLAAGGTVNPTYAFAFGTDFLDMTDPTHPTVTTGGLYWCAWTFLGSGAWNAGRNLECHAGAYPSGPQASARATAGTVQPPEGFVGQTLKLEPGDQIYSQLINQDTANRNVFIQELDVVLLIAG